MLSLTCHLATTATLRCSLLMWSLNPLNVPPIFNQAKSICSPVRPTCARNSRLVKCLLPRGLLCTRMAPKPGVAKWLSYGGITTFDIIPKNAWGNTLLGVTLTITVSNVATHVISSGVVIDVLLEVWIVSCVLTRPSRCSTTHKTGCLAK